MSKCNRRICKNVIINKVRNEIKFKPHQIKQINFIVTKLENYFQKTIHADVSLSRVNVGALDTALFIKPKENQNITRINANLNITIPGFKLIKNNDQTLHVRLRKDSPANFFKIDRLDRNVNPKRIVDFLIGQINYPPKNIKIFDPTVRAERVNNSDSQTVIKIKIKKEIFDLESWINFDITIFLKTDIKEFVAITNNQWSLSPISQKRFLSRDLFVNCGEETVEVLLYFMNYLTDEKGYQLSYEWQNLLVNSLIESFQANKSLVYKCPNIKFLKIMEFFSNIFAKKDFNNNKMIITKANKLFNLTINKRTLCSDVHLWNSLINQIKGIQKFAKN